MRGLRKKIDELGRLGLVGPLAFSIMSVNAAAQELQNELRGPVLASEVGALRLLQTGENETTPPATGTVAEGIPIPAYRPATESVIPVPAERYEDGVDNVLGEGSEDAETRGRTPSTARARSERRRGSLSDNDDSQGSREDDASLDGVETGSLAREERSRARRFEGLEAVEPQNQRGTAIGSDFLREEDDPYAPLGLRLGTFLLTSSFEQGLSWTSNANASATGTEAVLSESTLRLNAVSDWSRHAATLEAYGTFRRSLSGQEITDPEGGIDGSLRLDLAAETTVLARLGYRLEEESAASPVTIAGVEDDPLRHTIDGSIDVTKNFNRLRIGATGSLTREHYGEATLVGGIPLSQADRNATLATFRLRTGYQISPALTPFIEGEIGRRFYDHKQDSGGYERSANRYGIRTGIAFDIEEKLTGEASIGWLTEDIDDARLGSVSGLALAASLEWSPQRGTVIGFDGSTRIEGTTDAGEGGSMLYSGRLRLEREIRANLLAEAATDISWRDYTDGAHELTLGAQLSMTWWLNRYFGLTGRTRYETRSASLADREYDATSVFMGIRLQR